VPNLSRFEDESFRLDNQVDNVFLHEDQASRPITQNLAGNPAPSSKQAASCSVEQPQ